MFNLSFYKRFGFTTKKDGESILKNSKIQSELLKIDSDLQFFQLTKQDQLFNFIQSNFSLELSVCLAQEKINIANRKKEKSDLQKKNMKQEIIEEMKQEKLISEFPDLIVSHDFPSDLKQRFFSTLVLLAEQKKMTPDIYNEFLLMKSNYDACVEIIQKIDSFLLSLTLSEK
jgi:hypothetical protein